MSITRREFVAHTAMMSAAAASVAAARQARASGPPLRIGMTDWNLGARGDISKIALAREIGLDGIQVSLQFPQDGSLHLRDPRVQGDFRRAALDQGIQICSLAIGSPGKARLPLHTNPAAAILLVEAVEVARNLGTNNILLPILGDSHIDMKNERDVGLFVAMMKEVARHAERAGVVVALEDWISAEDNLRLLDAIGSDAVGVYYDARNIKRRLHDPYGEPTRLGRRIHQVHVKNGERLMRDPDILDWPRLAQEFHDIGYRGWYVLETNSPSGDVIADTRANIEYVRQTFRIADERGPA
ncbi:MAG TPA: sugar phosphate isomerase/epimerase family protein [Vicinamibacterales bacterium]|nr:sugar phosphate isomerase/epimerase family protein [Vicinamibacterales bacterium]